MLKEISILLGSAPPTARREDYARLIIEENILGKRTLATRRESVRRLHELYSLDPKAAVFHSLRFFWRKAREARPMLAFLCASARDPLLRMTAEAVLSAQMGEEVPTKKIEAGIHSALPNHFKPPVQHAIARHASSSWQQAGFLSGHTRKIRQAPTPTAAAAAYALLLGYLCGARGQFLLHTFWTRLLDLPEYALRDLTREASQLGWLIYRALGNIMEIDFPILSPAHREGKNGKN